MKALRVEQPNTAGIVDIPVPEPASDEVLVRVAAAGICGSDLELLQGSRPSSFVRYPIVPGHEWAGTVELIGAAVDGIAPGDRVVAEGIRFCGVCARCREGHPNLCMAEYAETGFTHAGAFAEYLSVPARLIHLLPHDASLSAAALLEPAACVANGLLQTEVRPGMDVAVVGDGTMGLLAVALFRLSSPGQLVCAGTREDRLALSEKMGATGTLRAHEVEQMKPEFDIVFEATNSPAGAVAAMGLVRRGGTVILEGISGSGRHVLDPDIFALGQLRVQGVFGASSRAWDQVVRLFALELFDPSPLITHTFALDDFEVAFAAAGDPETHAMKVHLVPAQESQG